VVYVRTISPSPALVAWLQVERVLLDVLDDVFLLHFSLEAAESTFDGLALLHLHFGHARYTPSTAEISYGRPDWHGPNMLAYHKRAPAGPSA
jgi:hypothetical protein